MAFVSPFFILAVMNFTSEINKVEGFKNLELLANQIVEGYISGRHKSPFHGFSAEFAEHKIYNQGESTRHIDWKLFAKTDRLYSKRYEEETNLRCHLILDNSSSMYYPEVKNLSLSNLNKIGFSVLAAAAIMTLLKKQRDAVGLSIYNEQFEFYAPERSNERHHSLLLDRLNRAVTAVPLRQKTDTYTNLHQIAEKLKRRSLVFLFTDLLQSNREKADLFKALHHLKFNKHQVVLFHTFDLEKEVRFDFDNTPRRFVDIETGQKIDLYADHVKAHYQEESHRYLKEIKIQCMKYRITYVPVNIHEKFNKIIDSYLSENQRFG